MWGDENKQNIDLGLPYIKTNIGGNARTAFQAVGLIIIAGTVAVMVVGAVTGKVFR